MDCVELSDLEEGEILEYEYCFSDKVVSDEGNNCCSSQSCDQDEKYDHKIEHEIGVNGFKFKKSHSKSSFGEDLKKKKPVVEESDGLVCISSSDGEYFWKEEEKMREKEDKERDEEEEEGGEAESRRMKKKEKKTGDRVTYGTVEDIMSEIGETIIRKKRCDYYKIRRSKDTWNKRRNSSESLRQKFYSNDLSLRKDHVRRRKNSSRFEFEVFEKSLKVDLSRSRRSNGKKKKIKEAESESESKKVSSDISRNSSKKLRDFDEVRRILLEKLKKQKEVEQSEMKTEKEQEKVNSEIQEVEMMIEVDEEGGSGDDKFEKSDGETPLEDGKDEELDLAKLRTMALASHKKRENSSNMKPGQNCQKIEDEGDFDRYELLLRAEALKTALLKKHQKILDKVKETNKKDGSVSGSSVTRNQFDKNTDGGEENSLLEFDSFKENVNNFSAEETVGSHPGPGGFSSEFLGDTEADEATGTSLRGRNKKKCRKSSGTTNSAREEEKNEATEEDDRTLRTQLLCDLIKKKSLKMEAKKNVLMESIQTSDNRVKAVELCKAEAETETPPNCGPTVTSNALKKANASQRKTKLSLAHVPKPQIQPIIVHLGSDDSSDEDTEAPASSSSSRKEKEEMPVHYSQVSEVAQATYEQSVELLLSRTRRKVEGEMEMLKDTVDHVPTPEAVYKHLPPSQRLEYIRLKQKIAERERHRKLNVESRDARSKVVVDTPLQLAVKSSDVFDVAPVVVDLPTYHRAQNFTNTSLRTLLEPSESTTSSFTTTAANQFKTTEIGKTVKISSTQYRRLLLKKPSRKYIAPVNLKLGQKGTVIKPAQDYLISKLKLMLKKIKIEKTIEENFQKEIEKLKNQVSIFEKKKSEQRFKIKKLWEESMNIYKTIMPAKGAITTTANTEKSLILGKADKRMIVEKNSHEIFRSEDASKTDIIKDNGDAAKPGLTIGRKNSVSDVTSAAELSVYNSPLQVFSKALDRSDRVDPNIVMCQFDLAGVCKDHECTYQHLRTS